MQLLFALALPLIVIYLLQKRRNAAKTLVPPGPLGLPLIGNLHQFAAAADHPHVYLWKLSQKYGPIMQMKLGSVRLLVVSSAEAAKEVLKTQDLSFCSRPKLIGQQKLSYNALDVVFSPYGSYWREVRKIMATNLLSLRKIQSFRPIREDEVSRMIASISSMIPSASSGCRVVNLNKVAMTLSSSFICRIAFGKRYDEHGSEMRRLEMLFREAQGVMTVFYVSDYFPWCSWVDKLTEIMDRLDKKFFDLDSIYQELDVDEHLDPKRRKKMKEEEDVLDVLIQLKEQKSSSVELGWDHIKALLMDIFVAATDTGTVSIVWTMTALMKAPNVMKKVQSEIRNFIGKKGNVDEDDLLKLPYLKAVIKETLRLYPPAPLLVPRETIERCTLEGYQIQPKTMVYVNAWAVARDPQYWENPDEFLPERFLMDDNIDITGKNFGVIPFGSGRRMCPGMPMGLANVELTVANLIYSFDWEMPPGITAKDIDIDVEPGLTMHKKNPLFLVAKDYVTLFSLNWRHIDLIPLINNRSYVYVSWNICHCIV